MIKKLRVDQGNMRITIYQTDVYTINSYVTISKLVGITALPLASVYTYFT